MLSLFLNLFSDIHLNFLNKRCCPNKMAYRIAIERFGLDDAGLGWVKN